MRAAEGNQSGSSTHRQELEGMVDNSSGQRTRAVGHRTRTRKRSLPLDADDTPWRRRSILLEAAPPALTAIETRARGRTKRSSRADVALCRSVLLKKENENARIANVLPRRTAMTSGARGNTSRRAVSVRGRDRRKRRIRRVAPVRRRKRRRRRSGQSRQSRGRTASGFRLIDSMGLRRGDHLRKGFPFVRR